MPEMPPDHHPPENDTNTTQPAHQPDEPMNNQIDETQGTPDADIPASIAHPREDERISQGYDANTSSDEMSDDIAFGGDETGTDTPSDDNDAPDSFVAFSEDDFAGSAGSAYSIDDINDEEWRYAPSYLRPQAAETTADTPDEAENDPSSDERDDLTYLEDLTLAELVDQFVRSPIDTWRAFWQVANPLQGDTSPTPYTPIARQQKDEQATPHHSNDGDAAGYDNDPATPQKPKRIQRLIGNQRLLKLGLYLLAFIVAVWGNNVMMFAGENRNEAVDLVAGAPYLLVAFLIWLFAEIFGNWDALTQWWQNQDRIARFNLLAHLVPFIFTSMGVAILIDSMDEPHADVLSFVAPGVQLTILGILLWVLLDVGGWLLVQLHNTNNIKLPQWAADDLVLRRIDQHRNAMPPAIIPWFMRIHPLRVLMILAGMILIVITWQGTTNNNFTDHGFYAWLASIALFGLALSPLDWHPVKWAGAWGQRIRQFDPGQHIGVIAVMVAIILMGAAFRITDLANLPPEMTSDHVEKILDAQRVADGARNIFFANNGGREPFQMYAIAIIGPLTGLGISFDALKFVAVLEALITLPVLFWLGYEIIGHHNRRLGVIVGLLLAALVAASYWHTTITRLSLRIILTPLVTSLLLIYLARAMRGNNRADFIKAGLILGFGLYMYQAVRMLPVVVVVAIGIAFYFHARTLRQRLLYIVNLTVLVFISFIVFVPMFHYSVENPEEFWRRTTGRLLGDDIVQEETADGTIVERFATFDERVQAFNENVPQLMSNIRNALLMFNWKGDVAWINGVPNHPAMDTVTGGLLIVGLAAWLAFALRRNDPVLWLMPVMVLIMLLPSALSIAFPIENPSLTRTSGAIAPVYLIAALPLGLIVYQLWQNNANRREQIRWLPMLAGGLIAFVVIGQSYISNSRVYFTEYPAVYLAPAKPHSEAGRILAGFANSDGAFGNAYMIGYPHWWDSRAMGIAAGANDWNNGIFIDTLPVVLRDAYQNKRVYALDPERDLLFFLSDRDDENIARLRGWFPEGRATIYDSYQDGDDFVLYRVPALGEQGFLDRMEDMLLEQAAAR